MTPQEAVTELKSSEEFFERSSRCLTEEDSASRPTPDMYTAAQQVAHAARTIDWFVEGATRPEGFDMDFGRHVAEIMVITSVTEARAWLAKSFEAARQFFASQTAEALSKPLPTGPVMGGQPV